MAEKQRARRRGWDAERVRRLRRHLRLTQKEMARELGTRQQTISEWETGQYLPRGTSDTLLNMIAERADFQYGEAEGRGTPREEGEGGEAGDGGR